MYQLQFILRLQYIIHYNTTHIHQEQCIGESDTLPHRLPTILLNSASQSTMKYQKVDILWIQEAINRGEFKLLKIDINYRLLIWVLSLIPQRYNTWP